MRWGLVPKWSKKPANTYKIFNARIETILEKPAFKSSMQKNRCVVLADGYYEWDQNTSQPYYLYHPKNQIIPMAGLWTKWNQPGRDRMMNKKRSRESWRLTLMIPIISMILLNTS